jgi:hypothetical protein
MLRLAVVASGLYHGVNPGMGWPLAVSAGLMEKSSGALVRALWPLTIGHLLALLVVILPFSVLVVLVRWPREIQVGASVLVIGFGIFQLFSKHHPRALARIFCRSNRARCGTDARSTLSWSLPRFRS